MLYEHDDASRSTTRRSRIAKVDDSGDFQLVDLKGLKNEKPKKIYRVMEFGNFSVPPDDTHGLMVQMGGRSDRTVYMDGGNPDYRPKDRPAGSSGLFDQYGDLLQSDKDQTQIVHAKKIALSLGKGYDAKDAADYSGPAISIVFEGTAMTLTYGNSKVVLKQNTILVEGGNDTAVGVAGRYVRIRPGRVDIGVTSPTGQAVPKVMTDAGPSEIVYAVIA